ncbi:hypothetical protein U1Q18_030252 [Sarracenia purpurea var. burkii]
MKMTENKSNNGDIRSGDGGAPLTAQWHRFGDLGGRSIRGAIDGALGLGRWEADIAEDDAWRCCTRESPERCCTRESPERCCTRE